MQKVEGVYIHDENLEFVRKYHLRCPRHSCNQEMWVFRDSKGHRWIFCMGSPAECGLLFPIKSSWDARGNVISSLHALRRTPGVEDMPPMTVPQLVEFSFRFLAGL